VADINEKLAALTEEVIKLEEEKFKALAAFGEKALPELKDNKDFSKDAEKINEIIVKISAKAKEETALLEEKEKLEAAERERIMKLTCFACHTVNPDGAVFCENCGAKLGDPPKEYCKKCGFLNQPGMEFCGKCGNKLGD